MITGNWQIKILTLLLVLGMACADPKAPTSTLTSPRQTPTATPMSPRPTPATRAIPPTPTRAPRAPSAVDAVLAATPLSFASIPLEFSDFAGTRNAFNYQGDMNDKSLLDFLKQNDTEGRFVYGPLRIPESLWLGSGDQLGLPMAPYFAFDLGVWDFTGLAVDNPTYLNIRGRYEVDRIGSRLVDWESEDTGQKYDVLEHQGVAYYAMYEDYEDDLFCCPLRLSTLNRIAILDDWLLASIGTDMLEALIDLRSGRVDSLMDSKSHSQLAKAVGEGMLSGAFRDLASIEESLLYFASFRPDVIEELMEDSQQWGALSPYALTLAGYRIIDSREEISIALLYNDPLTAKRDEAVLEHRWTTYMGDFATGSDPIPLTQACAPFTTEVIEGQGYSVLVGSCPLKRGEFPHVLLDQPYLWRLIPHLLLYPDLNHLEKPPN